MSALAELRALGMLGVEGARLLYGVVESVVRSHRFPSPEGGGLWSADDMLGAAHTFLTDGQTPRRLTSIALHAVDDASFRRLLAAAVLNHLRDQARMTDRAHLRQRLRDVLARGEEHDERFVRLHAKHVGEEHWALVGGESQQPWHGRLGDLVTAAWEVENVRVVDWRHAKRRGPVAERESLARILRAVLQAAGAPVDLQTLIAITEQRFSLVTRPDFMSIDDTYGAVAEPTPGTFEQPGWLASVWDNLTPRELTLLAHHDEPLRAVAERIGLGKSATADARTRLAERLRVLLVDAEDPEEAALVLVDFAREWVRRRTGEGGSPSVQTDGEKD